MAEAPKFTQPKFVSEVERRRFEALTKDKAKEELTIPEEELTIPETASHPLDQVEMPSTEEIIQFVKKHPTGTQFKNALIYIQGGTNMTLDRMIAKFDLVLADIYMDGFNEALRLARKLVS